MLFFCLSVRLSVCRNSHNLLPVLLHTMRAARTKQLLRQDVCGRGRLHCGC